MKPRVLTLLAPLILLGAALLPSGCVQGAELENKQAMIKARGCDAVALIGSKCSGGDGCHQGSDMKPVPTGTVDFFAPGFPENAIGLPAVYRGYPGCVTPPELIIDPTETLSKSLFLNKIRRAQVCGGPMPNQNGLPPDQIECLEDYIVQVVADWQAGGGVLGSGSAGSGGAAP